MKGVYIKRKVKKTFEFFCKIFYEVKRRFIKKTINPKDFTIISNNCWAGRVYQYLDMPYLSPTVGLYFFAPEYIRFIADLRKYLSMPLEFIKAEESKYYEEIKRKKQTDKPIGVLGDVEIVFLHYSSEDEAKEKWERRKKRVNYERIILKFSRMNLCTEKEIKDFDSLLFKDKFVLNNRLPLRYKSEVYWREEWNDSGIAKDTFPFPGNLKLTKLLKNMGSEYPENKLEMIKK